jgi:2-polyprenyl-6-methoxyphenol hydroxylase-like FAD-dependent oxidoreductase
MSASATGRVLIAGGGIGGLTAAIALRRVGFDAVVFERREDRTRLAAGAAFTLWHNAMRGLQQLGLAEQAIALGGVIQRAEIRTRRGHRVLATWSVRAHQARFGVPSVGVQRTALHTLLVRELGAERVRLGAQCIGFAQDARSVTVRFADGHEDWGDVLIGADGLHSAIRAQLLGPARPRYAGYTTWQGIADTDDAALLQTFRVVWGAGERFTSYPVGPRQLYWLAVRNAPPGEEDGAAGPKPHLLRHYREWPAPIPAVIAATEASRILRADSSDRPPVRRWGEGRVTLLGDAAHPMTFNLGQGACQAIEDSVVLGKCLGQAGDLAAALRDYEARRFARTAAMVVNSRHLGRLGRLEHPVLCRLRDRLIGITYQGLGLKQHEANMAYEF